MACHDTLGDFLTVIRNASSAGKATCRAQWSRMRAQVARILCNEGYIASIAEKEEGPGRRFLELTLKYVNTVPAITGIQRHSSPGCRSYYRSEKIPHVLGGLGICIVSTSKGIMKDNDARQQKLGGELLAKIW